MRDCEILESPAQCIWVNAVRLYGIFPAFIGPFLKQVITNLILWSASGSQAQRGIAALMVIFKYGLSIKEFNVLIPEAAV